MIKREIPGDEEEIKNLLKNAAEKGNAWGQYLYANYLINEEKFIHIEHKDEINRFLLMSANQGNYDAIKLLFSRLFTGIIDIKSIDDKDMFKYFQLLKKNNDDVAILFVADIYDFGYYTPRDASKAINIYKMGDSLGNLTCRLQMYIMTYEEGNLNEQEDLVLDIIDRIINQGDSRLNTIIGTMFIQGDLITVEKALGLQILNKFSKADSRGAKIALERMKIEDKIPGDKVEAFNTLKKIADENIFESEAVYLVAMALLKGKIVPEDKKSCSLFQNWS